MENIYKLEIITRSEKLNVLKESLYAKGIKGMSVSNVMGAGNQKGKVEIYRGSETTIDLIPKVKIEILAKESMLNLIIEISKKCLNTGNMGDGKIIVLPVLNVIRIRTGEEGEDAI
ncbi:P-II family nitrogen regulator [Helicobacter valdiviensis]|uniref:P-II family nitrogen regulator n=1 Tax=Helicobacter valdiviensis TaxID=1458358 RepID=A0A2W6MXD7_9HELI|nr:P-II family nitrogen regulator [Helicobacter valdiviensis]PZT48581.1 P-II family nitrogen regulator [Helicobacter valdiviensis]